MFFKCCGYIYVIDHIVYNFCKRCLYFRIFIVLMNYEIFFFFSPRTQNIFGLILHCTWNFLINTITNLIVSLMHHMNLYSSYPILFKQLIFHMKSRYLNPKTIENHLFPMLKNKSCKLNQACKSENYWKIDTKKNFDTTEKRGNLEVKTIV